MVCGGAAGGKGEIGLTGPGGGRGAGCCEGEECVGASAPTGLGSAGRMAGRAGDGAATSDDA